MGRKRKGEGHGSSRYITIYDDSMWSYILKLQTLDKYKNSFNALAIDALAYGLPELMKKEFDEEVTLTAEPQGKAKSPTQIISEKYFEELSRLLKENIVNQITIKSMLSSLFTAKARELNGSQVTPDKFERGSYKDIPQAFAEYEKRMLDEIE